MLSLPLIKCLIAEILKSLAIISMPVQSTLRSILLFLTPQKPHLYSGGKVLTDQWIERIESDFPATSFHHLCFTVPQELRELFKEYRFLLNSLFRAASTTMLSWAKERHFLPAMVCSCHTFHPHLHMLMSSGGIDLQAKGRWRSCSFIPFKMLQKRFRFLLLQELKDNIKRYLKENSDPGKLAVFSHPGVLEAFFDPLLTINW